MDRNNILFHVRNLNECANDLSDENTAVSRISLLHNKLNSEKDKDQLGRDVDAVLKKDTGIWSFLTEIKKRDKPSKHLLDTILEVLKLIIESKDRLSQEHTSSLFSYCKSVLSSVTISSSDVKDLAYKIFFLIAKHGNFLFFVEKAEEILSFLKNLYWKLDKSRSTEKQKIFQLIGVVAENFPDVVARDPNFLRKVSRHIAQELKTNLEKSDGGKISEVEGMLDCLFALFLNFYKCTEKYVDQFYNHIKTVTTRDSAKHVALRAAIKIIEVHFRLFADFIKTDYEHWYNLLNKYLESNNKDDSNSAKRALNEFYPKMAELLSEKTEDNQAILRFFLTNLRKDLLESNKHKTELAVKNFYYFAEPCKKQNEKCLLDDMFNLTFCLLDSYCSSFHTLDQEELINLSNMLLSTSGFLRNLSVEELKEEYLKNLEKATLLSISSFTKIPSNLNFQIRTPLLRTIINVAAINESYLDTYLENIIYSGIVMSCSHMTEGNVDYLQSTCSFEDESLLKELVTYKEYLPLWEGLLNINRHASDSKDLKLINEIKMEEKICDKFVECTLKIIEKLDLSMKKMDDQDQEKPLMVEYDLMPFSEGDFNIFINLVEMFSSLFSKRKREFGKWIPMLISKLIGFMYRHEVKFGFYRLLTVVFKQVKNEISLQSYIDVSELRAFVMEELNHLSELQKTDSKACLQMLMNLPVIVVNEILTDVAPALQAAFDRGSEDLLLADEALATLEKWYLNTPKEAFKPVLLEVIPCLKPFIQSKRFAGETDEVTQYEKKLIMSIIADPRSKSNQKYRRVMSVDSELDKLQKKVVKFLGKVDSDMWMPLFTAQSYVDWETVNILKVEFPFNDMNVKVSLDKFLPRVIDLACNSSDLKTRIAACEVLHSCVIVFIGNSNHYEQAFPNDAPNLFKKIIFVVFKLGADINETVQQLFRPLSIQLSHYYASKIQAHGVITNAFLEILFDAVITKNDATLRKFAAELITEFVSWSLKEASRREEAENFNIKAVIKLICLYSMQPNSYKKLGAALAFNCMYAVLKKNRKIIHDYCVMLFLHFVQNMSTSRRNDCNNGEVGLAIDNLTSFIIDNFLALNSGECAGATRTSWFEGKTLFDVQMWTFERCFSSNELCRTKCMQFLRKLLDGNNQRPELSKFLGLKVQLKFKEQAKKVDNLDTTAGDVIDKTILWMQSLSANLHCFHWMMTEGDVNAISFFDKEYRLFDAVTYFLEFMASSDLKKFICCKFPNKNRTLVASEEKSFAVLREDLIYRMLQIFAFSNSLTNRLQVEEKWTKNFLDIYINCLFTPYEVFPYSRSKIDLFEILTNILKNLKIHPLCAMKTNVLKLIQKNSYWDTFSNMLDNPTTAQAMRKQNTRVLFILEKADVLAEIFSVLDSDKIVRKIFHRLKYEENGVPKAIVPDVTVISYLQDYLTFALEAKFKNSFDIFIEYIFDDEKLELNSRELTHGMHFFVTFQNSILKYLLDHETRFIEKCVDNLDYNRMDMLEMYLKYASSKGRDCSVILKHWRVLKNFTSAADEKVTDLLNMLDFAIAHMKLTSVEDLPAVYLWLLECLSSRSTSTMTKHQILDLLPCFMKFDFCNQYNQDLKIALNKLESEEIATKPTTEGVVVYNKLLVALQKTANKCLFEFVIPIAILKKEFSDNVAKMLIALMNRPHEQQLELLLIPSNIFKYPQVSSILQGRNFLDTNADRRTDAILKIGIMEIFLVPMLHEAGGLAKENFFLQEINFIVNTAEQKIDAQVTSSLVSQIGALQLMETFYDVVKHILDNRFKRELYLFTDDRTTQSVHSKTSKIVKNILLQKIEPQNNENEDLLIKFRSHAFNVLIKILRRTKIDAKIDVDKWLKFIFEHKCIWKHIIKTDPPIKLSMSVAQVRTRRKQITERRKEMKQQTSRTLSIATEYATCSSLAPEISKYDTNHFSVTSTTNAIVEDCNLVCEERELDVLNSHECMTTLGCLVRFLEKEECLAKFDDNGEREFPCWMNYILQALDYYQQNPNIYANVVLFILKFLTNNESAFRPFAKNWFPTLMSSLLNLNQLNYVVTDVVLMLLQWHTDVKPDNREATGNLFKMFLAKIRTYSTTSRNYLMQMIKAMIQVWHAHFDVPYRQIHDLLRSSNSVDCNIGLDISKYFLLNNVFPYNTDTMNEVKNIFLRKVTDKGYEKSTAKILGLILRTASLKNNDTLDSSYEKFKTDVVNIMKKMNATPGVKTFDYFRILQHIVAHYPPLLQSFAATHFLEKFSLLQGDYKKSCLRVLAENAQLLPDSAFIILLDNGFAFCLKTKDHDLIESALKFIKQFMPRIEANQLEKLVEDICRLSTHNSPQCREAVYDVADLIYDKFRNETSEGAKNLFTKSRNILLAGLLDSDAELQEKIYESWKTRSNLEDSISRRFLSIIDTMYCPLLEAHFVSYAVDFLLEACASARNFDSLIFKNPLNNCTYEEVRIISSWRRKNASLAPCFMNSLPYKVATLGSQLVGSGTLSLQVYRTQTMSIPSISLEPSTSTAPRSLYSRGSFHPFKYIPPTTSSTTPEESKNLSGPSINQINISKSLDRLRRRIIENSVEASKTHMIRNAKLNEKKREILADRADRRDKNVHLKRQYRKGDFPDIQIKMSELIKPLKFLAKRDPLIAKQIFTNTFLGMINELKEKQTYLQTVTQSFNAILGCTQQRGSVCLETLFEIAYSLPKELKLDLQSVAIASNIDNLLSLRALLLENCLIYDDVSGPSTAKKQRIEYSPENDSLWIQLAEVYKSLDKFDVVNGIFKEKILSDSCQQLKNGWQSETAGDWERAYETYETEVNKMPENFTLTSQDQKFTLEAYYKCAAYLSKWDDMNKTIKEKFNSLDIIANDNWHKECTLPWLFLSEAYRTVYDRVVDPDFKTMAEKLLETDDPLNTDLLAEPLSMLMVVYQKRNESKLITNKSMNWILKEFNFTDSSVQKFLKLQTLSEISNMLSVLEESSKVNKETDLMLKTWQRNEPSKNNTTWWDRRMRYRYLFAELYSKAASDSMDDNGSILSKLLTDYELHSKLNFCEKALDGQNYLLAKKYTVDAHMQTENYSNLPPEWRFKLTTNLCRMYTFQAEKSNSAEFAVNAIRQIQEAEFNPKKCPYEYSMVASNLLSVIKKKSNLWSVEQNNDIVKAIFDGRQPSSVDWNSMIFANYQTACITAEERKFSDTQISSAYLAMAKHCREILNESDDQDVLEVETQIAISILKAMKYNSKEAYQLFPVLLQLNSTDNEDFIHTFIAQCDEVEAWKFLAWINQLLVYIDTDKVSLITCLVLRMARQYPKAFQFPFALSKEAFKLTNPATGTVIERIEEILPKTDDISNFITAMSFVSEPTRLWSHHYRNILQKSLLRDDFTTKCQTFEKVKQEIAKFGGSFWLECVSDLERWLKLLRGHDEETVRKCITDYGSSTSSLKEIVEAGQKSHLASYSKWLYKFSERNINDIEIPGQYDGFSIPHPEGHAKIFAVYQSVTMMHSLQKPIKIIITGDDAQQYSYLVKFNEDLRQDQRIRQLFQIINQALASKYYCNSQQFSLNTYGIFPLKVNLGMIEWVENSTTMKDFRNYGLSEEDKRKRNISYGHKRDEYKGALQKKYMGVDDCQIFTNTVKYCTNKSEVIAQFRTFSKQVDEDIFKKSLLAMTSTPHLFWCLRNQFMTSYSAMSICSWILGIGDRHLDNILVCTKSGTCIGIDFGLAFGTGTDFQPVPELIPFRMTPHIVSIMAPFYLTGLIRETMIQVLQTVRENDYVLLATLPVFLHDPSLDWHKFAKKRFQSDGIQDEDTSGYCKQKIQNVKLKLKGEHPLNITINELRQNPGIREVCRHYERVVRESNGVKIGLQNNTLSTEDQVDCLLGLATDEYVLGTSWCGLETWI